METKFEINTEVVRSSGDYVVGRIGKIIEIDLNRSRARVQWYGETNTWVSFASLEPTSIPYKILPMTLDKDGRRKTWPKYIKI